MEMKEVLTDIRLSAIGIDSTILAMMEEGNRSDVNSMRYLRDELMRKQGELNRSIEILLKNLKKSL